MHGVEGSRSSSRADSRVNDVITLLGDWRPESLLDVGCAEGSITAALGSALGVSRSSCCGCDVRDVDAGGAFEFTLQVCLQLMVFSDINVSPYSQAHADKLPYGDDSFDLVTLFMALHHMQDPLVMLSEVMEYNNLTLFN